MIRSHKKTVYEILGRDPVHPFPARMAPGIALDFLGKGKKPLRVLDPMMGSGTVLAVARSNGHSAMGVDIDPLAVMMSRVWTSAVDRTRVHNKAAEALERARRQFAILPCGNAYPATADEETRRFIRYWFDPYARRQLAALSLAIARIRDTAVRNVLWCAFSRLIVTKQAGASLAMDLSHSRPHKVFSSAPAKPFRKFASAVDIVLANCIDTCTPRRGPASNALEGDARSLPLDDESIDLVLTSPPYLNAIDYMRCSKFSLVWMGYNVSALRRLRAASVGTEVGKQGGDDLVAEHILVGLDLGTSLTTRETAVLRQYIADMRKALAEVGRVLVPGGRAVYIVGENTIRGTFIRSAQIVTSVAALAGLTLEGRRARTLPSHRRYLPPPSRRSGTAALDCRLRREVVLSFTKLARYPGGGGAPSIR